MEFSVFGALWFALIAVLIAGYFILDGFDLGVGILYPFVAKTEYEKAVARRSIGPIWDGNEVWLITAGGALFAAFAPAYATSFSGFYLAIMLVLMSLILRAVSIEMRAHDPKYAKVWDVVFFVSSLLPSLLFGVAIGNVFAGIPMDLNGDYAGFPLLGLLSPFTLLCGIMSLVMFICQGCVWLCVKAQKDSELYARSAKFLNIAQIAAIAIFVVLSVYALVLVAPQMLDVLAIPRIVFGALCVSTLIAAVVFAKKGSDKPALVCQSATCFMLVGIFATSMFPNIIVASAGSAGASITVGTAASSDLALMWMTGITCIALPIVLIYHAYVYRKFAGRITKDDLGHY